MRGFGCLVVALTVLGISAFFADQAITTAAERQTAVRVSRALKADAEVDLEGWPVALRMLSGGIPTATVRATDVPLEGGARLDSLDIVLSDVKVNVNDLRNNRGRRLPPARKGTFEAKLGEASVAEMMRLPSAVAVTLENGTATIGAAGLEVEADVEAREGDIVVSLAGPLAQVLGGAEFPIDLSKQPGAPAVRSVGIEGGVLTLSGDLEEVDR